MIKGRKRIKQRPLIADRKVRTGSMVPVRSIVKRGKRERGLTQMKIGFLSASAAALFLLVRFLT